MLDLRVKAPGIDRGFDQKILRVGKLLPELSDLDRHSQNEAALCIVIPALDRTTQRGQQAAG